MPEGAIPLIPLEAKTKIAIALTKLLQNVSL